VENEILLALISKVVEQRIAALPVVPGHRGPRGLTGAPGADGKSFVFSEHESTIRKWVEELTLKFEDLSAEQIESLRGPRGRDGSDGRDGKDLNFEEFADTFRVWLNEFTEEHIPKFEDFTAEQISAIRGPAGADGRNFVFEENKDAIEAIVRDSLSGMSDRLKLKFSDLSNDDIELLRGPRGRDGRDGRGFVFDEHREFFESLKPKFSDFTSEEREALRLHFSDLTPEEKLSLKLRFEDLTEDDRAEIRGARGPKGQKGSPGREGERGQTGPRGPRGLPGPQGLIGLTGRDGRSGVDGVDGVDGKDAPYVTDIALEEFPLSNEVAFEFMFSDGARLTTNRVKLPEHTNVYVGGGGNSGGKVSMNYETRVDEATATVTYVGKAPLGSETNNAVWQIQKIYVSGTETIIEWADSNDRFDNIWDNRASLTYG